ncbi:CbtA family protein [Vallicoccus soli]|uniref:CbtA family protein n=1 Tax=Vallicoccus soli TaxID=2339232 RepID=A0A3A3Z6R5_9ACTN|nr:CbtA family protein [Vallicoccus soli]RJK97617.1 hypothetical protein D5H78_00880 [Vallicoccus soli]
MARTLLVRGLLAGLVAGLLAFVVAWSYGEAPLRDAIAVESAAGGHDHGAHDHGAATGTDEAPGTDDEELVSRSTQSGVGLLTATTLYGVALGGVFALVLGAASGRLRALGLTGARSTAGVLALVGFVAVYLVPFLVQPANPPAVGDPDSIGTRTATYFAMVAASVALAVAAAVLAGALVPRLGRWDAVLVAVGAYVVGCALVALLLPDQQVSSEGFPADVLWRFRVSTLAVQAVLWAALGLVTGALVDRHLRGRGAHRTAPPVPAGA